MIVSLTTCPICQGKIYLQNSFVGASKYVCPSRISDLFPYSHYEVQVSGVEYIQVYVTPPYIVYNRSDTNKSHVRNMAGKEIMVCSLLKFESAEKLVERIQNLIIFS